MIYFIHQSGYGENRFFFKYSKFINNDFPRPFSKDHIFEKEKWRAHLVIKTTATM